MATYSLSYITREGFVAVIRRVITFFDPLPNLDRTDCLLTLFVNGGAVNDQIGIPVGVSQDNLVNCFVVVDELQEFRVQMTVPVDPGVPFYAQVYGQYLIKTNVPANFQVASCVGNGQSKQGVKSSDAPGNFTLPYPPNQPGNIELPHAVAAKGPPMQMRSQQPKWGFLK